MSVFKLDSIRISVSVFFFISFFSFASHSFHVHNMHDEFLGRNTFPSVPRHLYKLVNTESHSGVKRSAQKFDCAVILIREFDWIRVSRCACLCLSARYVIFCVCSFTGFILLLLWFMWYLHIEMDAIEVHFFLHSTGHRFPYKKKKLLSTYSNLIFPFMLQFTSSSWPYAVDRMRKIFLIHETWVFCIENRKCEIKIKKKTEKPTTRQHGLNLKKKKKNGSQCVCVCLLRLCVSVHQHHQ